MREQAERSTSPSHQRGSCAAGVTATVVKSSAGATEHLPVVQVVNLGRALGEQHRQLLVVVRVGKVRLATHRLPGFVMLAEGDGAELPESAGCSRVSEVGIGEFLQEFSEPSDGAQVPHAGSRFRQSQRLSDLLV